uniref:Uncharacterized protein n=1 Tax=viral metagenome TaxID=1070528 RepID=A0A6M3M4F2_9ZZZZ
MWAEKEHRNWLKWRLSILVIEEAWYFTGELAHFLRTKSDAEEDWRKFIYRLCLIPKNKDADALWGLSSTAVERTPLLDEVARWKDRIGDGDPSLIADELFEWLVDGEKLTDYEKDAIRVAKRRVGMGGMLGDKQQCIVTMILIAQYGIAKNVVAQAEIDGLKRWKGGKPKTVNLPWYVFDMHTAVGKMAMGILIKRKAAQFGNIDQEALSKLWFYMESGFVPKEMVSDSQAWWPAWREEELAGLPVKLWEKGMKKEIQSIVNWCLEKRS